MCGWCSALSVPMTRRISTCAFPPLPLSLSLSHHLCAAMESGCEPCMRCCRSVERYCSLVPHTLPCLTLFHRPRPVPDDSSGRIIRTTPEDTEICCLPSELMHTCRCLQRLMVIMPKNGRRAHYHSSSGKGSFEKMIASTERSYRGALRRPHKASQHTLQRLAQLPVVLWGK